MYWLDRKDLLTLSAGKIRYKTFSLIGFEDIGGIEREIFDRAS